MCGVVSIEPSCCGPRIIDVEHAETPRGHNNAGDPRRGGTETGIVRGWEEMRVRGETVGCGTSGEMARNRVSASASIANVFIVDSATKSIARSKNV